MKILVVGGAGYIGSHMVRVLHAAGHTVTVLDDLSTGFRDRGQPCAFVEGNFGDRHLLGSLLGQSFDAVMHFGGSSEVGESVKDPAKYYYNNVVNTLTLLSGMIAHDVKTLVFSSTAAIFGEPRYLPLDEQHPKVPINPYGQSKLMVENILRDYDRAYGLKFICLRYFNAAGADPEGGIGERHQPETHLIPLVLQAASGRRSSVSVFGTDYQTRDGTCVRDYIHVNDICAAHLLALQALAEGCESESFNLGNGNGFSIMEIIKTACTVTERSIDVDYASRRIGDPEILIANSNLIRSKLGWTPSYPELSKIIQHAWNWEQQLYASQERRVSL
jgi:UDP-glucose 4-epimerase